MALPNIFTKPVADSIIGRIENLKSSTTKHNSAVGKNGCFANAGTLQRNLQHGV
ncbi:MAG: hypothetical protein MUF45_19275 [Spirosomaceae bacterium]|nr:hypothetical protein [Spirosomataceae bacterium]